MSIVIGWLIGVASGYGIVRAVRWWVERDCQCPMCKGEIVELPDDLDDLW